MSATGETLYQTIVLNVSNAAAGQKIAVQLTSNGASVAWSMGPAFQSTASLALTSQSGMLPLLQLNVNSTQVVILTTNSSDESGSLNLQLSTYLEAASNIESFFLSSSSDPGVQVTASMGNSVPQTVNQTPTLFSWYPH